MRLAFKCRMRVLPQKLSCLPIPAAERAVNAEGVKRAIGKHRCGFRALAMPLASITHLEGHRGRTPPQDFSRRQIQFEQHLFILHPSELKHGILIGNRCAVAGTDLKLPCQLELGGPLLWTLKVGNMPIAMGAKQPRPGLRDTIGHQ